jgi:hypothetical protein
VSPSFSIAVEPAAGGGAFHPGDTVRGSVSVVEGGGSRNLTVALQLRERTRDYTAITASHGGEPVHSGALVAGTSFEFAIGLPADALPSYRSANGQLRWEVEAWSDERGIDTRVQREFEVAVEPVRA